jgi:hypothetical protein
MSAAHRRIRIEAVYFDRNDEPLYGFFGFSGFSGFSRFGFSRFGFSRFDAPDLTVRPTSAAGIAGRFGNR